MRRTRERLGELMSREVPPDLVVLMLDGVQVAEHTCIAGLGIDAEGRKHPLGIWEGATENKAVCRRIHKQRNVLGHLPESERPWVRRKLSEAWALDDAETAERRLPGR